MRLFAIDHVLVSLVNLLKTIARAYTTGAIFGLQFTKIRLAAGFRPDPLGELERSPRPLAAIGGLLLRGERKRRVERRGQERRAGEGGDGKGKDGEGREGWGRERKEDPMNVGLLRA